MIVYVTKYALTKGILRYEGEISSLLSSMFVADQAKHGPGVYFHGQDWHHTRESAVTQATEMRRNKVLSLKKQITKLESLTFEASRAAGI